MPQPMPQTLQSHQVGSVNVVSAQPTRQVIVTEPVVVVGPGMCPACRVS